MKKFFIFLFFVLFLMSFFKTVFKKTTERENYPIKWFYKLSEPLTENEIHKNYELYNIDLFDNRKEVIQELKAKNKKIICYFSFGTYENWREDVKNLDKSLLGNSLENWEGEKYWDIRDEKIKEILKSRIDLAKEKGCDGVELDNVDIYKNSNGLGIKKEEVVEVFKELSNYAKEKNLLVVLKNSPELVKELEKFYDLILTEECFEFNECDSYLKVNKPVLDVEYNLDKEEFCEKSKKLKISAVKACSDLNGCWDPCWEN